MLNWTKEKLVNVADIKMSNVDKKTIETEMPIQLCNYTDVYKNSYIDKNKSDNFMFASCSKNEYDKFVLKSGQVAITKDSEKSNDIGIPTYISDSLDNVVLSYHLALFTPFEDKLDGKFLRYWLDTKQSKIYFENNASGSGQRYFLALDTVKGIPLFLPELKEQQEISNLLFNLDSKIELNNKINKELEAMAKMLYDYWFVQFDFPNEFGKPYKSSGGKMVYNQELKREIPQGWESKKLDDIISKTGTGLNPRDNFKLGFGNNYYVTIKNIEQGKVILDDKCDKVDDEALKIINRRSDLRVGDILFTSIQPVGVAYLIQEQPQNWNINESVFTIRPDYNLVSSDFLFMLLSSDFMKAYTNNVSTGSIHKGVRHTDLKSFKFAYSGNTIIKNFNKIVNPMLKKMYINEQQNQELAKLRDWLLPMLMNGQVKVT